jgi:hypothetical protein
MNKTDKANSDQMIELESERDRMGEFERQFREPNANSRLRSDLKVEEVFEKAGFKSMKWEDLSLQMKSWIKSGRNKNVFGVSLRPWDEGLGYHIFGKPEAGTYYLLKKTGKDYAWTRIWLDKEEPHFEPLNHDSSLSEVIGTVAYHEFGEKPKETMAHHSKGEATDLGNGEMGKETEETRKKVMKNFRPWEK